MSGTLTNISYLRALLYPPYASLSQPEHLRRAIDLIGLASVYGFTRPLNARFQLNATLLAVPPSWHYLLLLLRHPPLRRSSQRVFAYFQTDMLPSEEQRISRPALELDTSLGDKPFADPEGAQWALTLLGVAPHRLVMPARHENVRPSDYVMDVLQHRRNEMIRLVVS